MTFHSPEKKARLMLWTTALIWGGGFVAGKMALTGLSPWGVLFWRFGLVALLFLPFFYRRILRAGRGLFVFGALSGVLLALALSVQLWGLSYTTSARQSFLFTTYVAWTPFVSWILLRKRPERRSFVAGFLALSGIGLIAAKGEGDIRLGDWITLVSSVLFTLQIVFVGKYMKKDMDIFAFSFIQFSAAAILSLVLLLFQGGNVISFGTECVEGVLFLGILNTAAAFTLQNGAQKYLPDVTVSLISSMESVFGFLFSCLYYGNPVTLSFLAGGALCFAAIVVNGVRNKKIDDRR
ncbi:DMT family transporter [uncultured Dialister sp.]|uniref:DMT family transporter n=1 Tax=uncultured Dialister sp. TaxID=278064 RepID=UPI00262EDD48|nr:DMT family transporter [uncultured Dialister sp.]